MTEIQNTGNHLNPVLYLRSLQITHRNHTNDTAKEICKTGMSSR